MSVPPIKGPHLFFILSLVILLLYGEFEAARAYLIKSALSQAANAAARKMAILYYDVPRLSVSRSAQDLYVYSTISYDGVVQSPVQFDDARFDLSAYPPTVSVTVHYTGREKEISQFMVCDPPALCDKFSLCGRSVHRLKWN